MNLVAPLRSDPHSADRLGPGRSGRANALIVVDRAR